MAAFAAVRWAEALLAAAGGQAEDAAAALAAVAAGVAAAGDRAAASGPAGAGRLAAFLERTAAAAGRDDPAAPACRLVARLAGRGRLDELPAVAAAAGAILDARAGRLKATVASARPLDAGQRAAVGEALRRRTGASAVELEVEVEPELIGGLKIAVGWDRIDGSLRRRLAGLAAATGAAGRGGEAW